ncbi:MAG: C40 family peptidase [Bacteroidetes bacterium]|nr:C40 family peptidase [Bacteroidota bacterium]
MKNLFFVSVAVGIFSGTSISVEAQTAVDAVKFNVPQKRSVQFIEGIEIKRDGKTTADADVWTAKPAPAAAAVTTKKVIKANTTESTIETCTTLQFKYAQIMDVEVELLSNTKLFAVIDDWWGTRYHYGGTTKKGIDCSAFALTLISAVYNINLPRTARDQYDACEKVDYSNLQEGDLVFFNTRGGVSHVGVYLTNGYFVHSSVHGGVTISSLSEDYYNRKFIGAGRPVQQKQ